MALASTEDMILALGEDTLRAIADLDGDRNADDDAIGAALEQASSLAVSYLPEDLAPYVNAQNAPFALRRAVVAVAQHYLRQTRDASTDDSRAMFADAVRWLEGMSSGKVKLVGIVIPPSADPLLVDPGDPEAEGQARIWNRASASKAF